MEIKGDMLKGPEVEFVKSPTHGGKFKPGQPDTVIIHYTAAPSALSALRTLTNPRVKASAHLLMQRDGLIKQMVPFNIQAWHAGDSSYMGRTGYNQYSIGIEIDNAGPLQKSGDTFRDVYGVEYPANQVIEAVHRNQKTPKFWHVYTEAQIEKTIDVLELLIETYNIKYILGHEEIAPSRKTDPGPAFPLDKIRKELLSEGRDTDNGDTTPTSARTTTDKLNIRDKPNGKLVAMPLAKGSKLIVLDKNNDWVKVRTEIEGWVSAKFIESAE